MAEHTTSVKSTQTAWRAELARERQVQPAISRERREACRMAFRRLRELYKAACGRPAA